jgi:isopenicillin N synthase-like dioxygenase
MADAFPIIDVSPLLRPGAPDAAVAAVAKQINAAFETIGFFAVKGHGVAPGTIRALYDAAYAFFDLPMAEKQRVARPRPEQNRGYIGFGDETLARLAGQETPPDLKELFAIGPFDLPDEPYFIGPAAYPSLAPNLWPQRPVELAPALKAYWHGVERLAWTLCGAYARALGLPAGFFSDKVDRHISQLRVMHYPARSTPPLPGQLRAGAHTDLSMMTLLYSDNDVGGLQVQTRAGEWVDAPLLTDAFVVNIGDLMMRWTNDRWVSTPHRVVNPVAEAATGSRRLSVGMFFIPNYDAEVTCLETCSGPDRAPRYSPTTVTAYRTERFARTAGSAQTRD